MPTELISQAVSAAYDPEVPGERANLAMITQAVIERQARLRAVLLSMPEFRAFIQQMSDTDHENTAMEILSMTLKEDQDYVLDQIDQRMRCYLNLPVEQGDTPLHVAIRLGEYSPVIMKSFREFANKANARGKKPLDLAVDQLKHGGEWSERQSIRANPSFMIHHMLYKNVQKTPSYKRLDLKTKAQIKNFQFPTQHLTRAATAQCADDLIDVLRSVGEDTQFTLKMKKQLAISCLQTFIQAHPRLDRRTLVALKQAINGDMRQAPRPELQYIRQLRSRLWLVRTIRGLLGGTATQVAMGDMLDQAIRKKPLKGPGNLSMFHHPQDADDVAATPGHRTSRKTR